MTSLRRRIFGASAADDDSAPSSRAPSPAPTTPTRPSGSDGASDNKDEDVVGVPRGKLHSLNSYVSEASEKLKSQPKNKSSVKKRYIFGLGGLFGLLLAGFFAKDADVFDLSQLQNMNLDSIIDVLPAGLIRDAHELQVCYSFVLLEQG